MNLRRTIVDPDSGRLYVVPAGGADGTPDTGDSGGTDGDSAEGETPDDATDDSAGDDGDDDAGRAGGPEALRADLVRTRRRAQEAEARVRELEQANETDEEARQREAAEAEALRQTATAGTKALRIAAVETAARDAGFVDPGEAAAILAYEGNLDSIEVDLATARPDRDTIGELVDDLAGRKPHLLAADDRRRHERGGSDVQGTGGDQPTTDPNDTFRTLVHARLGGRAATRR